MKNESNQKMLFLTKKEEGYVLSLRSFDGEQLCYPLKDFDEGIELGHEFDKDPNINFSIKCKTCPYWEPVLKEKDIEFVNGHCKRSIGKKACPSIFEEWFK
jgi:hypothetical protein